MTGFNDTGWVVQYQENFGNKFAAADDQTFGINNRLIFQLIDGGGSVE